MKKFIIMILISAIAFTSIGYVVGVNIGRTKCPNYNSSDNQIIDALLLTNETHYFPEKSPELRILNVQKIFDAKSTTLKSYEDESILFEYKEYPLQDLDFSPTDELVIMVSDIGETNTYITCDNNLMQKCKDEVYIFATLPGTTPDFYMFIYKNGFLIKTYGLCGMFLADLEESFRAVQLSETATTGTVISINNIKRAGFDVLVEVPEKIADSGDSDMHQTISSEIESLLHLDVEDFEVNVWIDSLRITIYCAKEYYDNFNQGIFESAEMFLSYEIEEYREQSVTCRFYNLL